MRPKQQKTQAPKCEKTWDGGRAVLSEARSKLIIDDATYNRGGDFSIFSLTAEQVSEIKSLFETSANPREDVLWYIDDNRLPMDV